jgi:hypothetical protein
MTLYAQQDLSACVLTLLDDHLAAMQGIRERMRIGTTTSPGARRAVALESIALAEGYAAGLTRALSRNRTHPFAEPEALR